MIGQLATTHIPIPEGLARELRIRRHRLETGASLDLEFHPDAADLAARMRASIPMTTFADVRRWLNDIVCVGGLVPQAGDLDALARGVLIACSDFPASVWSSATLGAALRTFKWFPKPVEVYDLLKPEADKVLDVILGLEAIAKAPVRMRAVPAREVYKPPPAPDWVGLKRGRGDHSTPPLSIPRGLPPVPGAGARGHEAG